MDCDKLNFIARGLPTKKGSELDENLQYSVTRIKKANTKYGTKLVVELDNALQVFLPDRVSEALLTDEALFKDFLEAVEKRKLFLEYVDKIIQFDCQ